MLVFKNIITDIRCYVKKHRKNAPFDAFHRAQRRQSLRQMALAAVLGVALPLGMLYPAQAMHQKAVPVPLAESTWDSGQVLLIQDTSCVQRLTIEEYLTGVVLAEMGPGFDGEALKAQAVVARTYTLRRAERGGRHPGCTVCTDHKCCQAWISPETFLSQGGTQVQVDKVRAAVRATDALVLRYEGQLIDATYFSCSGGSTEDAVAVWGSEVPYLQATSSPGEENAPAYSQTLSFTAQEFMTALGRELEGDCSTWFSNVRYTAGGGVETLSVCGQTYTGTKLRSLLGLRSTAFTLTPQGDTVTVQTRGYGHRVGMSQYGADAMARNGSSFREILHHYYRDVTLEKYREK